jgi:hypothetical protein
MSTRKVSINDKEIKNQLLYETICRKNKNWPLLSSKELAIHWNNQSLYRCCTHLESNYLVSRVRSYNFPIEHQSFETLEEETIERLTKEYPYLSKLLAEFPQLMVCGYALFAALHKHKTQSDDAIDLYFVDKSVEEFGNQFGFQQKYSRLLLNVVRFISDKWMKQTSSPAYPRGVWNRVFIKRNMYVTTVFLKSDVHSFKYRFIHRVYPNIGYMLGTFDLGPSKLACDGKKIYATEFGAWSAFGRLLVVDTQTLSAMKNVIAGTSFEGRIQKYNVSCNVIFPGLKLKTDLENHCYVSSPRFTLFKRGPNDTYYNHSQGPHWYFSKRSKQYIPDSEISDFIHKDYHVFSHKNCGGDINTSILRCNNVEQVSALLTITTIEDTGDLENIKSSIINISTLSDKDVEIIYEKFFGLVCDQQFTLKHMCINYKKETYERSLQHFCEEIFACSTIEDMKKLSRRNHNMIKLFAEYGKNFMEFFPNCDKSEIWSFVEMMIPELTERVHTNAIISSELLSRVNWIVKSQRTSSINPRDWYGNFYTPFTAYDKNYETQLRLLYHRYPFNSLGKDIFNIILLEVVLFGNLPRTFKKPSLSFTQPHLITLPLPTGESGES